jgi:hypothetical protein
VSPCCVINVGGLTLILDLFFVYYYIDVTG